jgi:alpha-galactosidase
MDDGWFGHRNNDENSLGDWFVNPQKLPGGLKQLAERINAEGVKFGIWLEPEMVSPDSELFRKHPDWAIQVPGREITMGRHQYVLDLTRQEVCDYIFEAVASVLNCANIAYVKWDMNRSLTDIGSAGLAPECMGQFYHRYVLGLYSLQERLMRQFPDLLLENCTGGGGRFDPGMLYYSPQIWTSDNMDPIQRLLIQEGTALVYPLSTMVAHVCVANNHCNGRVTPLHTRAYVAMAGTFGYELDITKLSQQELDQCAQFNAMYHKYSHINRDGDYYRIASYRENGVYDCWQVVGKDQSEFLLTYIQVRYESRPKRVNLRLEGLQADSVYRLSGTDQVYSGDFLMKAGYPMDMLWGDYNSVLLHFEKQEKDNQNTKEGKLCR